MIRALFVALLVTLTGCYSYIPVQEAPDPGTPVRAYLTPEGSQRLVSEFGPGVQSLEGRFLRAIGETPDSLVMIVDLVKAGPNTFSTRNNTGVHLPHAQVMVMEAKQMDVRKSVLLAAIIGGGFYFLGQQGGVFPGFGDGEEGEQEPPPATFRGVRVPIRIPLP